MGVKSTLRRLAKALPILVAAAPAAIETAKAVKQAVKKKKAEGR